jgi:cation diffusion facilitator CzcD-associated flavoprotein CzcO
VTLELMRVSVRLCKHPASYIGQVASGLGVPNAPDSLHGINIADGYETLPTSGEAYEGKTVAVIGMGNAAFETVDFISE